MSNYPSQISTTPPLPGTTLVADINAAFLQLATTVSTRTTNTIIAAADARKLIVYSSGTFSQTFTAAATLADGFLLFLRNEGSGVITLDPNGSETIDGATTYALKQNQACIVYCDGANFHTIGLVAAQAITYAQIQNVSATSRFLGRKTAGAGSTEELSAADAKTILGYSLTSSDFANQGTTTTVLHGNASGNPSFGAVSLTGDVSGTLPLGNGGTGVTTVPAIANLFTAHTTTVYVTGSGTYTTPANCRRIRVRIAGGGAGGGGTGSASSGGAGGNGGATTFGSLTANGGTGGNQGGSGGNPGTAAGGFINVNGTQGGPRWATGIAAMGGMGGTSLLGTGGMGGEANGGSGGVGGGYGAGGGGGGCNTTSTPAPQGGGGGGYVETIISPPAGSYSYAVGAAGTAGTAGTSGVGGGAGTTGAIFIEEYYV